MKIDELKIDKQFSKYLLQAGFNEEKMNPVQKSELCKAFYAAVGMMLKLNDRIATTLDEKNAIASLNYIDSQVKVFWVKELKPKANETEILVPQKPKIIPLNGDTKE